MNYRINKAVWENGNHDTVMLNVTEIADDEREMRTFPYVSKKSERNDPDFHPIILWDSIEFNNTINIEEDPVTLVLQGKSPVPEGCSIVDGQLRNDDEERLKIHNAIGARLDVLHSGRTLAMAERNHVYDENRRRQIDALLSLEERLPSTPPYSVNLDDLEQVKLKG